MMKSSPCYQCENRCQGCHGTCKPYAEWKAEHDAKRDAERDARRMAWTISDYNKQKLNKLRKIAKHREDR
jgi:hypothetical protein